MPANEANPIYPSERERRDLEALVRQQTCAQHVALRARIVLLASEGVGIQPSATRLGIARTTVRNWRRHWLASTALACEDPCDSGRAITHWTQRELAAEAIKRGIVPAVSQRSVGRILKRCRPQTPSCARVARRQARSAVRREVP